MHTFYLFFISLLPKFETVPFLRFLIVGPIYFCRWSMFYAFTTKRKRRIKSRFVLIFFCTFQACVLLCNVPHVLLVTFSFWYDNFCWYFPSFIWILWLTLFFQPDGCIWHWGCPGMEKEDRASHWSGILSLANVSAFSNKFLCIWHFWNIKRIICYHRVCCFHVRWLLPASE